MEIKMQLIAAYVTDQGRRREQNQDNLYVDGIFVNYSASAHAEGCESGQEDSLGLYGVFDGMGGEACGKQASLIAACEFQKLQRELNEYAARKPHEQIETEFLKRCLKNYAESVHDQISQVLQINHESTGGTTCAAVIVERGLLFPFWNGDSRIYLFRNGQLQLLSKDHTMGQRCIEMGTMTETEARKSANWHMLLSYLGDGKSAFTLGEAVSLQDGDKILICSDGITDVWLDEEIQDVLLEKGEKALEDLLKKALEQGEDNITAIFLQMCRHKVITVFEQVIRRLKRWLYLKLENVR